jgi:hypothetical protein
MFLSPWMVSCGGMFASHRDGLLSRLPPGGAMRHAVAAPARAGRFLQKFGFPKLSQSFPRSYFAVLEISNAYNRSKFWLSKFSQTFIWRKRGISVGYAKEKMKIVFFENSRPSLTTQPSRSLAAFDVQTEKQKCPENVS